MKKNKHGKKIISHCIIKKSEWAWMGVDRRGLDWMGVSGSGWEWLGMGGSTI